MNLSQGQPNRLPQRMLLALLGSVLLHFLFIYILQQPDVPTLQFEDNRVIKLTLNSVRSTDQQTPAPARASDAPKPTLTPPPTQPLAQLVNNSKADTSSSTPAKVATKPIARSKQNQIKKVAAHKSAIKKRPKPSQNRAVVQNSSRLATNQSLKQDTQVASENRVESIDQTSQKVSPEPQTDSVITRWLEEQLQDHFHYPRLAQRKGLQGTVTLQFTVQRDGLIDQIAVLTSSGHGILDRSAQKTLQRIGRVDMQDIAIIEKALELSLPVTYRLEKG